jgi:hypothetical protein
MDKNIARLLYKRDLQPINNLKVIFRKIRDYLAGNLTGITGDESIARQMMFLLFCKIYDEQIKAAGELVDFSFRPNEKEFSEIRQKDISGSFCRKTHRFWAWSAYRRKRFSRARILKPASCFWKKPKPRKNKFLWG